MDVCVLGSGSKGNCIAVSGGGTTVLVDFGLSTRQILLRMREAGLDPAALGGILFTHDHIDHFLGIDVFARKCDVPLFANEGTADGIEHRYPAVPFSWTIFETSCSLSIGGLGIDTFPVSHDASDPVGFVFHEGNSHLFVATDLGCVTAPVRRHLDGCQTAVLESNHDYEMLMKSDRTYMLKQRIAGRSGHLSNDDAAELIRDAAPETLRRLLLAHLSEECNTPHLAASTMCRALAAAGREDIAVETLSQNAVSGRYAVL
ncbi:MAG: MBL fold metallo-hydrolase [Kiritimatiellae bacterium]|nr:MBL fold metallo-hydrolase [Kiritimatiellia bacterium]